MSKVLEFLQTAQGIIADFGITTRMGLSLAEDLAINMRRLRHVRAMEIATLDPGPINDRDIENIFLERDTASGGRSDAENDMLLQAYADTEVTLSDGGTLCVQDEEAELITADLWRSMTCARKVLNMSMKDLDWLNEKIAADPKNIDYQQRLATKLNFIAQEEESVKQTDKEVFGLESESDIKAHITGQKKFTPEQKQLWTDLMKQCKLNMQHNLKQIKHADGRLNARRQQYILSSVGKLESLNQLGEYEVRIQRSIAKTIALIKEVEKMAVIDVY